MTDHYFDSATQTCLGCDLSATDLVNGGAPGADRRAKPDPRLDSCPSVMRIVKDQRGELLAVIAAPDRLVVTSAGGVILFLGAEGARMMLETARPMFRR